MILWVLLIILMCTNLGFAGGLEQKAISVRIPASEAAAMSKVFQNLDANDRFRVQTKAGNDLNNVPLLTFDGATEIKLNSTVFEQGTEKSKKQALNAFVVELRESAVSDQTQQNLFNSLAESDRNISAVLIPMVFDSSSADIYGAMKVVNPILPTIRLIIGIGVSIVIFLLMGSTVIDLAYIGLPMWRENQSTDKEGGSRKPPFVTNEAISTVKEVESAIDSNGKYKNAYLTYAARRATTYIILGACILYLVVGELGGLITWLLTISSGLLQ